MGFLIYKRTAANGSVRYTKLKPLKLGGRDGLIAKHVQALTDAETRSWKLDAITLLQLAGHDAADAVVLFDVAGRDATSVSLYELTRIHGSCRDTSTQIALDLSVLIDREVGEDAAGVAQEFDIRADAQPKRLGETLSLSGGPAGGDWKWGTSALQIGATVVPAHHSGPPCPNCTCGRTPVTSAESGACLT
jgi:hypothetical protein